MIRVLLTITLCSLASVASATRANLFIDLYGINPDTNWTYTVRVLAGATLLDRPAEYLQRPQVADDSKRPYGRRIKLEDVFFAPAHETTLISIIARPQNQEDVELYFPLHILSEPQVRSGQNITLNSDTMRATSDVDDAIANGFPFYDRDRLVSIESGNLVAPLTAVREIVRSYKFGAVSWERIYSLFNENALKISQEPEVSREVINILHTYSESNTNEGFTQFYLLYFRKDDE